MMITDWHSRTDAALNWIRRSMAATGGQGSAHSYSPLWGWARAYPETSGYLIPTLLRYAALKQDDSLRALAGQCTDWLCTVQLPDGAFPGGIAGQIAPSLFNTSQILFGFVNIDKKTTAEEKNKKLSRRQCLERATRWAIDLFDSDGGWRQAAYRPGFEPAYYTRAVWGILDANRQLQWPGVEEKMQRAIRYYGQRFQSDGTISDWGLKPGPRAFTHTIAYTLEGFWESALLLGEPRILEQTLQSAEALLSIRNKVGRTAGRYGPGWRGDYTFRCLSGNAQLSVLYHRIWELTGDKKFHQAAINFLSEILPFQKFGKSPGSHGALAGSAPVWGPYLRFRYPNWGVKFFLDAMARAAHHSKSVPS